MNVQAHHAAHRQMASTVTITWYQVYNNTSTYTTYSSTAVVYTTSMHAIIIVFVLLIRYYLVLHFKSTTHCSRAIISGWASVARLARKPPAGAPGGPQEANKLRYTREYAPENQVTNCV